MSNDAKPHKRVTARSLAYKQGKVVRRFKASLSVHDNDPLFAQLGSDSLYTVYTDTVDATTVKANKKGGNRAKRASSSHWNGHTPYASSVQTTPASIPAQILLMATGQFPPAAPTVPEQQMAPAMSEQPFEPAAITSPQDFPMYPTQQMVPALQQQFNSLSAVAPPLQFTPVVPVAQQPIVHAVTSHATPQVMEQVTDVKQPIGPDIPRPIKPLRPDRGKVVWDRYMAENYDDSYSEVMTRGRLYPKFKDKEEKPKEQEEPTVTAGMNLFNFASLMDLPVSMDVVESTEEQEAEVTEVKKEPETDSKSASREKVLDISECFVDFSKSKHSGFYWFTMYNTYVMR